jgi:DNA transformation protein
MPKTNEFCEYLVDRLAPLGTVTYRFMFGGYSIYLDGGVIAIVADDTLLLRADDENRGEYEARGIGPFRPFPDKPMSTMPFYQVPDDVFEDQDELLRWAELSRAATLRHEERKAAKGKGKGRKKKG